MKRSMLLAVMALFAAMLLCSCELVYDSMYGDPSFKRVNILVYGNDYAESLWHGNAINPLYGTVNDATQVGLAFEALAENSGLECNAHYILGRNSSRKGEGFRYDIPNAIESPDTDTSMAHFKDVIAQIAASSTKEDLTVIFVSCHGWYDAGLGTKAEYGKAKATYFATSSNTGDECILYPHDDFLEDVSAIAGVKLILADVCYSGGLVKPGYVSVVDDEYLHADASTVFLEGERIDIDPSLYCLSASRYYEESFEYVTVASDPDSRTHGYFTVALLEALGWDGLRFTGDAKASRNGMLTFQGLSSYVVKNDGKFEQNPMSSDGSMDIVLFSL